MKVSKLISELKKMPKDLDVGVSMHDNYEEEVAGWPVTVYEFNKKNYDIDKIYDKRMFNDMPEKCVIIHC